MSEEAKAPSAKEQRLKELQQEYSQNCVKLGNIEYQVDTLQIEASKLKRPMRQLNKEAARLQEEIRQENASAKS